MKIEEMIDEMRHCIGLNYSKPYRGKYEAWRNYCVCYSENEIWKDLIKEGLGTLFIDKDKALSKPCYIYSLTRKGLDFMGKLIGAKITERGTNKN